MLCLHWALCFPQQRSRKAPKRGQCDVIKTSDVHSLAKFSQFTDDEASVVAFCESYIYSVALEKLRTKQVFISMLGRSKAEGVHPPTTVYAFTATFWDSASPCKKASSSAFQAPHKHMSMVNCNRIWNSLSAKPFSGFQPLPDRKEYRGECKMSLVPRDSHLHRQKKKMERKKERRRIERPGKGISEKKNGGKPRKHGKEPYKQSQER